MIEKFVLILPQIAAAYFALINLVAVITVVYDKHISKLPRGSVRRVPEKRFVVLSALGGGIGTLSAMLFIRHKTKSHNLLLLRIGLFTTAWISVWLFLLRIIGA